MSAGAAPVAVIMAVYGRDDAGHFEQALQSVLAQDVDGRALHVYLGVDGPLPAPLEAVIHAHRARLHAVSRSEPRRGLAATLNRLIGLLQDEAYVFRMDADDLSLPRRFARQLAHLEANADVDILGGAMVEFLADGRRLPARRYPGRADVRRHIARGSPLAHPTVCFRRRALDRLRAYPEKGTNEDIALWFAALRLGMVIDNLDDELLLFRVTSSTMARRSVAKARSELGVYLRGLYALHGLRWDMVFPLARFAFRLCPPTVVGWVYRHSRLRTRLVGGSL